MSLLGLLAEPVGRSLGRNARREEKRREEKREGERKKDCSVSQSVRQSGSLSGQEKGKETHTAARPSVRVYGGPVYGHGRGPAEHAYLRGKPSLPVPGGSGAGPDSGVGGTGTLVQRWGTRPLAWCPDLPRRAHGRGRADRIFRCDFRVDCWATHCFLVPIGKSSSVMRSSMGVYGNSITEPGTSYAGLRESGAHSEMHAYTYLPPRARTKLLPDRARPYERTPAETTRPMVGERERRTTM